MTGEHKVTFHLRAITSPLFEHERQYFVRARRGDLDRSFDVASCQYGEVRCPVTWTATAVVHFKSGGRGPCGYKPKYLSLDVLDRQKGNKTLGTIEVDITLAFKDGDPTQGVAEGLIVDFRLGGLGGTLLLDLLVYPSTCPPPMLPSQRARREQQQRMQQEQRPVVAAVSAGVPSPATGHHTASAQQQQQPAEELVDMSEVQADLAAQKARCADLGRVAELESLLEQLCRQLVDLSAVQQPSAQLRVSWRTGKYRVASNPQGAERRAELERAVAENEEIVHAARETLQQALDFLGTLERTIAAVHTAERERAELLRRQSALEQDQAHRDVTDEAVALFAALEAADAKLTDARDAVEATEPGGVDAVAQSIDEQRHLVQQLQAILQEDEKSLDASRRELLGGDGDGAALDGLVAANTQRVVPVARLVASALVSPPPAPSSTPQQQQADARAAPSAVVAPAAAAEPPKKGPQLDDLFAAPSAAPTPAAAVEAQPHQASTVEPWSAAQTVPEPAPAPAAPSQPDPVDLFAAAPASQQHTVEPTAAPVVATAAPNPNVAPQQADLFAATPAASQAPQSAAPRSFAMDATVAAPTAAREQQQQQQPPAAAPTSASAGVALFAAAPSASSSAGPKNPSPTRENPTMVSAAKPSADSTGAAASVKPQPPPSGGGLEHDLFFSGPSAAEPSKAAPSSTRSPAAVPAASKRTVSPVAATASGWDAPDDLFADTGAAWPPAKPATSPAVATAPKRPQANDASLFAAAPATSSAASVRHGAAPSAKTTGASASAAAAAAAPATDLFASAPSAAPGGAKDPRGATSSDLWNQPIPVMPQQQQQQPPPADAAPSAARGGPGQAPAFNPFGTAAPVQREEVSDSDLFSPAGGPPPPARPSFGGAPPPQEESACADVAYVGSWSTA